MKPLLKSSKLYIYNTTENQVHVQYIFPEQNEESLNCLKLKKRQKIFWNQITLQEGQVCTWESNANSGKTFTLGETSPQLCMDTNIF